MISSKRTFLPSGTQVVRTLGLSLAVACFVMAARDAAAAGTPPGGLAGGAPIESATRCKSCHGGFKTDDGHTYMPWDTWAGSMMANAARDPLFLASVTVAEQDRPGSGSFCLRCHTPSAHLESRSTSPDPTWRRSPGSR